MRLIPAVASYLGLQGQVKATLTDEHLMLLQKVAAQPLAVAEAPPAVAAELIEMHVLQVVGGIIGATQGPSRLLRATGQGVRWQDYTGKYAKTKVGFYSAGIAERG